MPRKSSAGGAGEASGPRAFIAYYRVSTAQQGSSGLGLEAQREAVARHIASTGGRLVDEYEEIESGKRNDRPQIAAALAACRAKRAVLVIAKLDRLARNVAFISALMDSGVDFVAADMPLANRLTVHVLAAVAEHEREMISQRTKAALQAAKARGVKLGNPHLKAGDKRTAALATAERRRLARAKVREIMPYIEAAEKAGCRTLKEKAQALTNRGIRTPGGCSEWSAEQVRRIEKAARTLG
jgi:DNA invertase Pin-like site-specific DNA recombinase